MQLQGLLIPRSFHSTCTDCHLALRRFVANFALLRLLRLQTNWGGHTHSHPSQAAVSDSGPNDVNRIGRDLNFSQKQQGESLLRFLFAVRLPACLRDVSETLNGPWKLGKEGHRGGQLESTWSPHDFISLQDVGNIIRSVLFPSSFERLVTRALK